MNAERVREQLERILGSSAFADAARGSRFLRFVVEATLAGRTGEIKESVIGVEVLGRSPSFDPKTDPIVRVEAGRLRARLSNYYQNEGRQDPLLISLPKGGYVPEFSEHLSPASSQKAIRSAVFLAVGALLGFFLAAFLLSYFRPVQDSGAGPDAGPFGGVGRQTFDGKGNTGATATVSVNGNILHVTIKGTYVVNPDCTGSMTLLVSAGAETFPNHVDLVIVQGGNEFRAINADPGIVLTTVGKKQFLEQ